MTWQNPQEDELEEDEPLAHGPDPHDQNDQPAEIECAACGQLISDEADRCPWCGNYVVAADAPRWRNWLWIVAVVLLVLLVLRYTVRW